jgi:flavin reductase (DIM6/NTAB) family NADH-FMN oxidoreductase RutF
MDNKTKQKALRMISNGMYVMTTRAGERIAAATVTWLSQASFKPPMIMVAVRRDGSLLEVVKEGRAAVIHMLGIHQEKVAREFLTSPQVRDETINGEPFVSGTTGVPILTRAPAYVECRALQIIEESGDHAVVLLEVVDAVVREDAAPLLVADSPWEYGG